MTQDNLYQAFLKWIFTLICLVIPLLYWPPAFDPAGIPREMLIAISAGIGLVIFSIYETRPVNRFIWHRIFIAIFGLLIWVCVSYSWSMDRHASILSITQFISLIALFFLSTRLTFSTLENYIFPATMISATIAGIIGIGQHFGFNPLLLRQSSPPASTFLNVNYAANYFDLITPISLAFLFTQKQAFKPTSILSVSAFTASLGFQVISQSRGSWLALLISIISLIIVCRQNKDFRKIFLSAIRLHRSTLIFSSLIIVTLIISLFFEGPHAKFEKLLNLTVGVSIKTRLDAYLNALVAIKSHPLLGVGYGAFVNGFSPYVDAVNPIAVINQNIILQFLHSDPLQMFVELGLVGGLLSIFIFVAVIVMAWRIIKSDSHESMRFIGFGLMLALLASGAHSWVDFPLHLPTSAFYFWLWAGVTIGLYTQLYPQDVISFPKKLLLLAGMAGLFFVVFTSQLYTAYLQANSEIRTAMINALHHHCRKVYSLSDKAMDDFGLDYFTRFWYAKVYTYCDAPAKSKLKAMNRILALTPNMPLPYLTRARIELGQGELKSAASDFNSYRKLLKHRPEGYIGLAKISLKLGDRKAAHYWLRLANKHVPNDPMIQRLVKQLKN